MTSRNVFTAGYKTQNLKIELQENMKENLLLANNLIDLDVVVI